MNLKISTIAQAAFSLVLFSPALRADEAADPSWRKASDNKIYAQKLANEVMDANRDLINIGVHASKPGTDDERMIASNLDRIGKVDDDDDKAGAKEGKSVLNPNYQKQNIEVLIPLNDASGKLIGALALVFPFKTGDEQGKILTRADQIRDQLARKIETADDMFKPSS